MRILTFVFLTAVACFAGQNKVPSEQNKIGVIVQDTVVKPGAYETRIDIQLLDGCKLVGLFNANSVSERAEGFPTELVCGAKTTKVDGYLVAGNQAGVAAKPLGGDRWLVKAGERVEWIETSLVKDWVKN